MSKDTKTDESPSGSAVATRDLSDAITESVEKAPGEEVRSIHVYGDCYRCNWWVQDKSAGPAYLNVGRISKSKFIRATMSGEKLVMEDLSHKP